MVNYLIRESFKDAGSTRNAGSKARNDIEAIAMQYGFNPLDVLTNEAQRKNAGKIKKLILHYDTYRLWEKALKGKLAAGDVLLVQFPVLQHSLLLYKTFHKLRKNGVKIILLIHDMDMLREGIRTSKAEMFRIRHEEQKILEEASVLIVHNIKMVEKIRNMDIRCSSLVSLDIFDYLIPDWKEKDSHISKDLPFIIAGNLSSKKAGYLYDLPEDMECNVYGVNYDATVVRRKINYMGSYAPDQLPMALKGSFGIVWDGPSADTCSGSMGQYLKINNPHKTSLYLSAGIPVVIWKQAALASFIEKYHCGIAVDSLKDVVTLRNNLSNQEYEEMKQNASVIGKSLRNGNYTLNALKKALEVDTDK